MCFEKREVPLSSWTLPERRIRNFKEITDFMLREELIKIKGRSYFELSDKGQSISTHFSELANIRNWLDEIIKDYINKTGVQALSAVLDASPTAQYIQALENAGRTINNIRRAYLKYKYKLKH